MRKLSITAIVLVGQEINQDLFKKCIKSLSWCDEVLKIDTKNIKGGFSSWRNRGLQESKSDWVLYIDTDEEVSLALKDEILEKIKAKGSFGCFAIPRKNFIFGQEFKYGGQWPDYQKRLFLKSALKKWTGDLHEEPQFVGDLGFIKNPIIHHKDLTLSQMIDKTNKWSEIEGQLMFDANHPKMNAARFASVFLREFYTKFIKELSFLDGTKGIIYGIYQIYSRLISYSKLWEKQQSTIRI